MAIREAHAIEMAASLQCHFESRRGRNKAGWMTAPHVKHQAAADLRPGFVEINGPLGWLARSASWKWGDLPAHVDAEPLTEAANGLVLRWSSSVLGVARHSCTWAKNAGENLWINHHKQ